MKLSRFLRERNILRIISLFTFLGIWQLLAMVTIPLFLPSPLAVIGAIPFVLAQVNLPLLIGETLFVFSSGLLIGVLLGIPVGILIALYDVPYYLSELGIIIFYSTPIIAVIPLIIIWFGLGYEAKIAIVALASFFPMVFNSVAGVRNVDAGLHDMFTIFGARRIERVRKLVLPSILPYIGAGLRITIGRAIILTVAAEILTAASGLGGEINVLGSEFMTAPMFVPLMTLILIAFCFYSFAQWIESAFTHGTKVAS